jgi:hypothetical protein
MTYRLNGIENLTNSVSHADRIKSERIQKMVGRAWKQEVKMTTRKWLQDTFIQDVIIEVCISLIGRSIVFRASENGYNILPMLEQYLTFDSAPEHILDQFEDHIKNEDLLNSNAIDSSEFDSIHFTDIGELTSVEELQDLDRAIYKRYQGFNIRDHLLADCETVSDLILTARYYLSLIADTNLESPNVIRYMCFRIKRKLDLTEQVRSYSSSKRCLI